jgi:hypothetical protein
MRPRASLTRAFLVVAIAMLPATGIATPILGQVDLFEDGTTLGGAVNFFGGPPPSARPAVLEQLRADNITATAVPEPMTLLMVGTGLAVIGIVARRRR